MDKNRLRQRLTAEQYEVTQYSATEAPFSGKYDNFYEKGLYVDIVDKTPLFISTDKYDAGCGWPSFSKPITKLNEKRDTTFGMERVEVRSKDADSHLGHVFNDGPSKQGGLRYCINSASLEFIPYDELDQQGLGKYKELFDD